jgi:hypothetical protein
VRAGRDLAQRLTESSNHVSPLLDAFHAVAKVGQEPLLGRVGGEDALRAAVRPWAQGQDSTWNMFTTRIRQPDTAAIGTQLDEGITALENYTSRVRDAVAVDLLRARGPEDVARDLLLLEDAVRRA